MGRKSFLYDSHPIFQVVTQKYLRRKNHKYQTNVELC